MAKEDWGHQGRALAMGGCTDYVGDIRGID